MLKRVLTGMATLLVAATVLPAASLTPDGENSVYAKARDVSTVKGLGRVAQTTFPVVAALL